MRKIVVAEFISLDGVVEAPDAWHFPYVDDQMMGALFSSTATTETMLLGRRTYESYAGAFADTPAGDPVGEMMNKPNKLVATRTLTELAWHNSEVLRGDLVEEATRRKAGEGGDILTTGSISVARQLLRAGLVDELSLLVHPIVVGAGQRLFEDGGPRVPLALVSCDVFGGTGVTHQVYRPA
jgi:dihydrofolate reductase